MSLCAPEWDRSGEVLDAVTPTNCFFSATKGKGDSVHQKRGQLLHLAFVPGHACAEPSCTEDGHVTMQGQSSKGSKSQWQLNYSPHWTNGQETEEVVVPSKPPTPGKDSMLEAVVNETGAGAPAPSNNNIQDDEMVSWLQYPLDDSLERNYCSDFFGELPSSNMQVLKDSLAVGQGVGRGQRLPLPATTGNENVPNRATSAEAAMALGAGRAVGLTSQAGAEAFTKVRTLHPAVAKGQPHSLTPSSSKGFGLYPTLGPSPTRNSPPATASMLPPKLQPVAATNNVPSPSRKSGPMNFSHFSQPAARMKANLHSIGMASPPPNTRFKQHSGKNMEACTSTGSSIAESTTTGRTAMGPGNENEMSFQGPDSQPESLGVESSWPVMPNPVSRKEEDPAMSEGEGVDAKSKPPVQDTGRLSSVTGSAVLASSEKGFSQGSGIPDLQEPTITSSSGGSGNSAERATEAATRKKRRTRETEDTECQSEDGEDGSVDLKKPLQGRGSTAKRSRAAEVHNLSERRRRDRINEKMKALQELIPNSNKTDKASMLDEAIEYLKMLQLQLQMMSMRSGMSIPPMVMPAGMQHLQVPQMTPMPPMGMSMGMGIGMGMMGMGMGMMDMSAATSGRAVIPMPSHAGPSHNSGVPGATANMSDVHDPRMHNANVMESLNAYMARQHQSLQIPQPLTMDMYNAYMLHQHQLQQHQHQHQHQHHHHHHQPANIGGGPLQ